MHPSAIIEVLDVVSEVGDRFKSGVVSPPSNPLDLMFTSRLVGMKNQR